MKIDIDKLTAAELIDLNNRIVERLRFLSDARARQDAPSSESAIEFRFKQKKTAASSAS